MIRVDVEDYCHQCLDFCPDVIKPQRMAAPGGELIFTDTVIQCENRKRCAGIRRFLEMQMKEEASG